MSKALDEVPLVASEAIRAGTTQSERDASDTVRLERVAKRLRQLERAAGLERTLAIGEMIFNECYGGREELWRVRRRNCSSVRRLALRQDCPFSKSALNDAVSVYVLAKSMPDVRTFGHVQASHIAAATRLPSDQRMRALHEAELERLSVRELKKRIAERRRAAGERRGRPRGSIVSAAMPVTEASSTELDQRQERLSAIALELERVCVALRALASPSD